MFARSLQTKLILPISALIAIATLIIVTAISGINSRKIEAYAQRESQDKLANVGRILAVTDAIMMERVRGSMKLLMERGAAIGSPAVGKLVDFNGRQVRDLLLGSAAQANRFELVDGVTASQGGTATLFSRVGDDFIRISTNVQQKNQRAIGTLLDPNGQAIRAIRQGRAFYGQVDILGTPFLTGYEPMFDSRRRVIGAWYVGYKVDMQSLQEAIARSRILKTGFIALVDDQGKVRFHSDNVTPQLALQVQSSGIQGWSVNKETFAPWDFVMVAAYPSSEVTDTVRREIWVVVTIGLLLCGSLVGLMVWLARSMVIAPLKDAVAIAERIAMGNWTRTEPVTRDDEIGGLLKALNHMQESLQRLDRLKSDFLSSVSHELRTPLTSIRGFTSLIEREFSRHFVPLADGDPVLQKKSQRIQGNLEIILKESERLTRLINDVLDLAKIEAGRVEWHAAPIQPETLLRDAANAARGAFGSNPAVSLQLDIQPDLPEFVGDTDRLLQVLVNLLNNAAKFTQHGSVTLKAFLNHSRQLQIEVHDTGIGFRPEDAEVIFDKFQQSKHGDTLADRPRGTGLGLAICREFIQHHGGKIWATSQPGVGSVFSLTLPIERDQITADLAIAQDNFSARGTARIPPPPAVAPNVARRTILVVDDEDAVRNYLSQLLQEYGYGVSVAANGQAALELAHSDRPDLITMDLDMPVMDGQTAILQLRADPELQHIPVMVVSAIPGWDKAGGDLAMGKPIDESRFLENVRLLLDRDGHTAPASHHCLVLHDANDAPALVPGILSAQCMPEFCSVDRLAERIQSGYQGMVAIPVDLLGRVDMARLQAAPLLGVMIMPHGRERDQEILQYSPHEPQDAQK